MGDLELTIEKLVYGGEGLARANGEVIFTPFVLPDEKVIVERNPAKKGTARARLVSIQHASPDRVQPECPVFMKCGGCHYQHIDYPTQLRLKREILVETLARVGRFSFPAERIEVESAEPWGYRNRVQFHFESGKVGFNAASSHRLVPTDQCPISSPAINQVLTRLNEMVKDRRWPTFLRSLELFTNEEGLQWNVINTEKPLARHFFDWLESEIPGSVGGTLDYPLGTEIFQVRGKSFFQVNRYLVERLSQTVIGDMHGDTAWDLYAGVGLFSLELARRFQNVIAVESGRAALQDLRANAAQAGVTIEAVEAHTNDFLTHARETPDFVVADPPREGLGKVATARLLQLKPARLVIVACDPATLARDLAVLQPTYEIEHMTLVDLFPQTFHMETVVRLKLVG